MVQFNKTISLLNAFIITGFGWWKSQLCLVCDMEVKKVQVVNLFSYLEFRIQFSCLLAYNSWVQLQVSQSSQGSFSRFHFCSCFCLSQFLSPVFQTTSLHSYFLFFKNCLPGETYIILASILTTSTCSSIQLWSVGRSQYVCKYISLFLTL